MIPCTSAWIAADSRSLCDQANRGRRKKHLGEARGVYSRQGSAAGTSEPSHGDPHLEGRPLPLCLFSLGITVGCNCRPEVPPFQGDSRQATADLHVWGAAFSCLSFEESMDNAVRACRHRTNKLELEITYSYSAVFLFKFLFNQQLNRVPTVYFRGGASRCPR